MHHLCSGMMITLLGLIGQVMAQDRFAAIPPAQYTSEQRQAAADFLAARKTPLTGPFESMMYSPQVMTRARAMGDYLRYKSLIGNTLSEFVILITARNWSQDYEWSVHAPIAAKAGISADVIGAIRIGRRPAHMNNDETIVYDFSAELMRSRQISDATFARAEKRFGKAGVVDLAAITGYYTFLAMQLNTARYRHTGGAKLDHLPTTGFSETTNH